jgi:hypothetical protein
MVKDALVDVKRCRGNDAAAEEGLLGHVNDVANGVTEGWICVCQKLVGFSVADGVAGPGAEERCKRGVSTKHEHVDVELIAQEVLEGLRVEDGGVVYLDGCNGWGGGDAFALGGLQFQLDAALFRVASQLAGHRGQGKQEDAEGVASKHPWPAELAMVEGSGEGCRDVDRALENVPNVVGSY